MNLALEKVNYLKGVIARSCRIPPDKQVLLISGGESLDAEERVCKYAAGTDTNPIFLFSLISIESSMPPEIHPEIASEFSESELNEKVNSSLKLEDAQSTVAIRATLAQEYVKASSEQTRMCEMLIHDQHLQHQGWSAVVANLEDLATDLKKHSERLEVTFHEYLEKRENHLEVIDTFDNDLAVLHRIPVFPALLNPDVNPEMSMVSSISFSSGSNESVSLLEWINSRGSSQSLELVAESCYKSLQQLDHELLDDLRTKVNNAVEGAQNSQMKEVRGLGDRLSGLEQLLLEAKRIVTEQQELAAAFLQNQQRAYGLKDASILPDLCASHRQQLLVMKKNHQSIMSICSRTAKAKNELSANLHHRMKWVVFIQNQMSEVGQLLVMHVEELKRLRRKLDVVEQIHMAPSIYMATAVEVVRRRAFADHYLYKANSLADTFSSLHDEELVLRINFQSKLKKHFLSKMFPGMEDQPPSFATSKPVVFDNQLPEITLADVELLRNQFPDLAKSLSLPEENALSNLLAKSFNQTLTQEEGETLYSLQNMPRKISMTTRDIGSMSVMNQLISGMRKQSSRMSAVSDSDDETDNERMLNRDRTRRYSNGKKKKITSGDKLTRSLPHESVTSLTRNNGSTGFNLDLVDPSSSSADPSSSSAGNTTGNNSVAPSSSSDGSVMKQQTPSTSLMQESSTMGKLAEERAALIASLNIKVAESEAKLDKLQTSVRTSLEPCHMSLSALKKDLANMKSKLVADQDSFQKFTDDLKLQIVANVVRVNENSNKRLSLVMEDVEQRARKQSESDLDKIRDKLELEMQKLEDSHREIDIYQQQLQQAAQEADKLKTENIEAKELHSSNMSRLKEATDIEKAEIIKKLTLEHEIELDALREELENSEKVANCEAEVKRLREVLQLKESDVEALRRKTRLLEMTQEEKFHEEKEKIVQILEAGFVQREKLALQQYEDELTSKFQSQLADSRSHWELEQSKVIEALKEDQQANYSKQLSELDKLQKNNIEQMAHKASEELRQKFDEDREAAMKQQHHQLTLKAKRELDALRYRFKMMQTTGAFEQRSPSASESELSLEVLIKSDFVAIPSSFCLLFLAFIIVIESKFVPQEKSRCYKKSLQGKKNSTPSRLTIVYRIFKTIKNDPQTLL
jgi:hypothetical protein